ncbi:MAG: tetraacyldisaccharide 4'-kinase [Candidatus Omnitrophica bacterium]|nr:tetraacyldisaccharide 4'-kinase [Candidatus Omnitrophota bacterium]MDD5552399.1 tetraacyldisaccharide 4'-kinase [Candidatus Omnitrophota bacterium]
MLAYLHDLATDRRKGFLAGTIKSFLYPASLIYGLAVRALTFIYRLKPRALGCKVISAGNITLGGTGKTSLVLLIARYLKENGHKVAIVSRGYKRQIPNPCLSGRQAKSRIPNEEAMGDEPAMLKMNLKDVPVIVDADRICGARIAVRDFGADTVILDDGFQQWRLKKDLDIVAIDAVYLFGNRRLIPRGILREPLSSLKRADMFILTKSDLAPNNKDIKEYLNSINPAAPVLGSIHSPVGFYRMDKQDELLNINSLRGKTAVLFSGIGDPGSFEKLIKNLGIRVEFSFRFRDHHNYTRKDLDNITRCSEEKNTDAIITTEKDAVRIRNSRLTAPGSGLLYLRVELKITDNEQEFHNRLLRLYSS